MNFVDLFVFNVTAAFRAARSLYERRAAEQPPVRKLPDPEEVGRFVANGLRTLSRTSWSDAELGVCLHANRVKVQNTYGEVGAYALWSSGEVTWHDTIDELRNEVVSVVDAAVDRYHDWTARDDND